MKKILALALFGLTAVVPITAIPVAAQTVAAEQTVTFAVDNMTCALCPVTVKRAMEGVAGVRAVEIDFAQQIDFLFKKSVFVEVLFAKRGELFVGQFFIKP